MNMRRVERAGKRPPGRPEAAASRRTARGGWALAAALAALLLGAIPAGRAEAAAAPKSFSETYGTWRVSCGVLEANAKDGAPKKKAAKKPPARSCVLQQRIDWQDKSTGRHHRLLIVTLGAPVGDKMPLTLLTPFGLLLDRGVRLRVDKGKAFALRFRTCLAHGCVVRGQVDARRARLMRKGRILNVDTVEATGETLFRVPVSLKGFTAAYRRLIEAAK